MRKIGLITLLVTALIAPCMAQVLSPGEIADKPLQDLQDKYLEQLKAFAADARAHKFAYPFSFSRTLDVEMPQQAALDQRSVSFDTYNNQTVLKITGNYFASYSTASMDFNHRTRQTFSDVVLPLLALATPRFNKIEALQAYAFEISHHIRNKVLGVDTESFENVVYIFPRNAAERLVNARTPEQQQAAVLDSQIYVNGDPFMMWLTGDPPSGQTLPRKKEKSQLTGLGGLQPTPASSTPVEPTVNPKLLGAKEPPLRIVTAENLGSLKVEHQAVLTRLARELDQQAHFLSYSPPSFIRFRNGAYLQLSVMAPLSSAALSGSRYKVAALAFDEHIAHLVRPVLAYFSQSPDFDGVDFSTSVQISGSTSPLAVEFIFPMKSLRCYANYDCTGQQLIDAGIVLINDDRVSLDLQTAEK
jgi:hypothetical protein